MGQQMPQHRSNSFALFFPLGPRKQNQQKEELGGHVEAIVMVPERHFTRTKMVDSQDGQMARRPRP